MARYAGKSTLPVITDDILNIVHDAFDFQESDFCKDAFYPSGRNQSHADPKHWKWVKIHTHRRAGFSTTALKLLNEYRSSLIVTHNYPSTNRLRQEAIDNNLVPDWCEEEFYNNIRIDDHIIPVDRMDERWFIQRRPNERYQLIIIDGASMIEPVINNRHRGAIPGMDELRNRLFDICDLLVELS